MSRRKYVSINFTDTAAAVGMGYGAISKLSKVKIKSEKDYYKVQNI